MNGRENLPGRLKPCVPMALLALAAHPGRAAAYSERSVLAFHAAAAPFILLGHLVLSAFEKPRLARV